MNDGIAGTNGTQQKRLKDLERVQELFVHFLASPESFSNEEFQAIAREVYKIQLGRDTEYTGRVPYLDQYDRMRTVLSGLLRAYFPDLSGAKLLENDTLALDAPAPHDDQKAKLWVFAIHSLLADRGLASSEDVSEMIGTA